MAKIILQLQSQTRFYEEICVRVHPEKNTISAPQRFRLRASTNWLDERYLCGVM